uniref:Zinc finger protein RFP-like n=1 Tax=Podarcis muralis TaxID=64176 RepID=A0A670HUS6_PODMU
MADEGPVQNLCEETTCSICREYFTDPVIIDCGHIFCQSCITEAWGNSDQDASCPQCREPCQQRNVRPNRQLASIVEIVKKFSLQMARGVEALGKVCERHQEPLKLFCKDDQAPICVVCDKSKEHRDHKVIPKEEAFEEYQVGRCRIGDQASKGCTDMERQKIMADFQQSHQFLEEQERLLLAQLKELDNEIKSCEDQHIAKLSEEMSSIDDLIKELEEKQKQPATEFFLLQQKKKTWSRNRQATPVSLPRKFHGQRQQIHTCTLPYNSNTDMAPSLCVCESLSLTVNIVLDPETANHYLILSEDGKSVRCGGERQNLPDSRKRFDPKTYVLGSERFRAVRKWWEVEVGGEKNGQVSLQPSVGIWAVGKAIVGSLYGLWAFTAPERTPLLLNHELRKIRVTLDYEKGSVGFLDVEGDVLIFTFPEASFFGEEIRPFFLVGQGAELSC